MKDPAGVITINKYDLAGRLKFTINNVDPTDPIKNDDLSDPDGEYQYPPQNSGSGNDIFNLYTRYYYDARGNQIGVVDTDWNITRTYYDLADHPIAVVQNLVIDGKKANEEF